jgi:hypothetical protein
MYKLLLLASIENVRFKGGIYTIAKALLRKSELFEKKWMVFKLCEYLSGQK